jgi:zinc finger HIT domain-containing protein 1
MEDDVSNPFRRMSMRTRKIAPKMAAALASNDNRTQVSVFLLKRLKKKIVLQLFDQLKKSSEMGFCF